MRFFVLLALVASALRAQSPPAPDAAARQAILARTKDAATHYVERLQDFTCTQTTTRSDDNSGTGQRWKVIQTQEEELNFVGHKEHYRLLKLDGKAVDPNKRVKRNGLHTVGEFGSMLKSIFDPKARADFEWDHAEAAGQCVFRYRIARENSSMSMKSTTSATVFGHHGLIYANCDTGAVLRIHAETNPGDSPTFFQVDLTYALATIAGTEFLLPQSVQDVVHNKKTQLKSEIRFGDYRKFDSSTSVKFEDEVAEPAIPPRRVP